MRDECWIPVLPPSIVDRCYPLSVIDIAQQYSSHQNNIGTSTMDCKCHAPISYGKSVRTGVFVESCLYLGSSVLTGKDCYYDYSAASVLPAGIDRSRFPKVYMIQTDYMSQNNIASYAVENKGDGEPLQYLFYSDRND